MVQRHDENSEGLPRRLAVQMVKQASGHTVSSKTAERVWDRTVKPYGVYHGLLKKSHVAAQAGSSKRTQAGNYELQKVWYETVSEVKNTGNT